MTARRGARRSYRRSDARRAARSSGRRTFTSAASIPSCESKRLESLKFFVSKDGMDIEFFGPELVARLYDAGRLNTIADFYKITKDILMGLERMGDRLADKVLDSINARRRVPLSRFLQSLGIRNVGGHVAVGHCRRR